MASTRSSAAEPAGSAETLDGDDRRATRKRAAIVAAATTAFLRTGYLGTSMDEIAARAGVSKQTVYKHFADKERLFTEVVVAMVAEAADPVHEEVGSLQDSTDVEADLRDLARRQLALVMRPRMMQLRRLVIAEAGRFPELGRTFHEQGPGRTIAALATAIERLSARRLLHVADPVLAATQFNWLVMSAPLNEAMLLGHDEPDRTTLDRTADEGVATFLAAYGPAPRPSTARPGRAAPTRK